MSSTGRGSKGGGDAEFFPTPCYPVERLIERCGDTLGSPRRRFLEPTAGDGAILRAFGAAAAYSDARWTACELRPECRPQLEEAAAGGEVTIGNFLELGRRWVHDELFRFDVAITNPPFSLALQVTRLCLDLAPVVIILQRSPWIGDDAKRRAFFSREMPARELRVGRIDFDGRGGDSIPYSWFVWDEQRGRTSTVLELLPQTPAEQRVRGVIPPKRQRGLFG